MIVTVTVLLDIILCMYSNRKWIRLKSICARYYRRRSCRGDAVEYTRTLLYHCRPIAPSTPETPVVDALVVKE